VREGRPDPPVDTCAGVAPIAGQGEDRVVIRLRVPDVSDRGQPDRTLVEMSRGRSAPAPSAVHPAGVPCDLLLSTGRAQREEHADALREGLHELDIQLGPSLGLPLAPALPEGRKSR
jgi:hypothetical protein